MRNTSGLFTSWILVCLTPLRSDQNSFPDILHQDQKVDGKLLILIIFIVPAVLGDALIQSIELVIVGSLPAAPEQL